MTEVWQFSRLYECDTAHSQTLKYKSRTIFFRMGIMTVVTALVMSIVCLTTTTAAALPINKKTPPTSVFGICTKIGTFHKPSVENPSEGGPIKMLTQEYTKVRWRVSEGRIVVKFKVGLEKLCKNFGRNDRKCRRGCCSGRKRFSIP